MLFDPAIRRPLLLRWLFHWKSCILVINVGRCPAANGLFGETKKLGESVDLNMYSEPMREQQ
jgi:hypothetical protein|tara:strand:- start:471 stop:656 length:186 start_codon:yes stop_codon:yes gene_type:complete